VAVSSRASGWWAAGQAAGHHQRVGDRLRQQRLIGRKFSSPQVQDALGHLAYQVVCGQHDDVRVKLAGTDLALPEISAMILRELKADAEAFSGGPVTRAVITVPAYFNDGQRRHPGRRGDRRPRRAAHSQQPTAAALAYGFGKTVEGKLAVFDLGGGTFDVSVLEFSNGVFEVIATGGDTFWGEDFDNRVIDWLASTFLKDHGVDLRTDRLALQRLKDCAEKRASISRRRRKRSSISPSSRPSPVGRCTCRPCSPARRWRTSRGPGRQDDHHLRPGVP